MSPSCWSLLLLVFEDVDAADANREDDDDDGEQHPANVRGSPSGLEP